MICPKCGYSGNLGNTCLQCGIDMRNYKMLQTEDLAKIWKRFAAFIVDGAIMGALIALVYVLTAGMSDSFRPTYFKILRIILYVVVVIGYYTAFEASSLHATVGKKLMGIVVSTMDGKPIDFKQALIRNLARPGSIIILIGLPLAFFTEKKQTLYDVCAKTLVINKNAQ